MIVAAVLIISDPHAHRVGEEFNPIVSAASLLVNFPGALFWVFNERLEKANVSIYTVMFWQVFAQACLFSLYSVIDGSLLDTSDSGIFGFLRPENWLNCLFFYSFLSGFWGLCGYVIAATMFSPLIIMNCLLLEPILS